MRCQSEKRAHWPGKQRVLPKKALRLLTNLMLSGCPTSSTNNRQRSRAERHHLSFYGRCLPPSIDISALAFEAPLFPSRSPSSPPSTIFRSWTSKSCNPSPTTGTKPSSIYLVRSLHQKLSQRTCSNRFPHPPYAFARSLGCLPRR